ncbi:2-(3-amino-3-carboxypropyl)histidine synthase subunit 2 isoform X2 [Phalaenopsis equestris]|nr:2-(3-amino-3-carboxypropyl)histidine synthase subunit 2 isoform X2 [Phalaenopsis equestris]
MADTAYGSCCVDEIGAAHIDADCVVHFGHACMSPLTTLPAFFVFGKSSIDVLVCVQSLHHNLSSNNKPILILFGLEYAHALEDIKAKMVSSLPSAGFSQIVRYAEVTSSIINPSDDNDGINGRNTKVVVLNCGHKEKTLKSEKCSKLVTGTRYGLGGLEWSIPVDKKIDDYIMVWIGSADSAFANVVLTFNSCEIVRYDPERSQFLRDFSGQRKTLKRRYYLVEKAKDANIVGILVGTLAIAGYLRMINQMKELIEGAGKKSYTLVMGRPNTAKLANFPECDVFVYVSCAQTALLDSKDFLAPVITPFEATLAFGRGKDWTGEYVVEFGDLMISSPGDFNHFHEARFSFFKGGYIEDVQPHENEGQRNDESVGLELSKAAMNSIDRPSDSILFNGSAQSGVDFFVARSFKGLNIQYNNPSPPSYIIGRRGRAAGYDDERKAIYSSEV